MLDHYTKKTAILMLQTEQTKLSSTGYKPISDEIKVIEPQKKL